MPETSAPPRPSPLASLDSGSLDAKRRRLVDLLDAAPSVAIAVSGGVDSMTLGHIAAAQSTTSVEIYHAVSPAVPPRATERVRDHAERFGWALQIVGAGEFDDPDYLKNPLNRCYFCKTNLYARIRAAIGDREGVVICSGANTDDLGDFRPGLGAAAEHGVRHPFVEATIGKTDIRALAAQFGLDDIADLPAQPCLASRVETGLAIDPDDLALIDRIERDLVAALDLAHSRSGDVRCRVTRDGVRLELPPLLAASDAAPVRRAVDAAAAAIATSGRRFAGVAPYRRGSAFLQPDGAAAKETTP